MKTLSNKLLWFLTVICFFLLMEGHAQYAMVWQKCYGCPQTNWMKNMVKTADGGYLLLGDFSQAGGDFSGHYGDVDIGVIKIDSLGNKLWSNNYGSTDLEGSCEIIKGYNGKFFIVGCTRHFGFPNFHGYPEVYNKLDCYMICIDSLGNKLWEHCYGGFGEDVFYSGLVMDSSYVYAAGYTWRSKGGDTGGNYDPDTTALGTRDVFICKINASDGSLVHAKRLGGSNNEIFHRMIIADENKILLLGNSGSTDINVPVNYGQCDAWALKIDTSFNVLSSKIFGGSKKEEFMNAVNTPDGGYVLFGYTENTDSASGNLDVAITSGSKQLLLIKTDNNLQSVWQKTYGCNIVLVNGNGSNSFLRTTDKGFLMAAQTVTIANCTGFPFYNGQTALIKTDSIGNMIFENRYGTTYGLGVVDVIRSIIPTKNGGYIVGAVGHLDNFNLCNDPGINHSNFWNIYKLDNSLGIEQNINETEGLKIYPNPANDILNIDGLPNNSIASVFDLNGKLLIRKQLNDKQINIGYLAKGLYFIKLNTEEGSVVRKFVKE